MTRKEITNGLACVLLSADLSPESSAAIGNAIAFMQDGFFNEDASKEIDRLTLLVEQKDDIIERHLARIWELENARACA